MRDIKKYRFSFVIIPAILLCVFLFSQCVNNNNAAVADTAGSGFNNYAGSAKCMACHKAVYDSHQNTAHFKTSAIASAKNILGRFDSGKNTFTYSSGGSIAMLQTDSGYFQAGYVNGVEKKRQRFDMVIGSGTKGQSFAAWVNNNLVQLPVTFFTSTGQWCNSPGYPNKMAFNRPITSRCLECHATYAEVLSAEGKEPEAFDKNRLILGVDCEKCHGPAAKHVAYHKEHAAEKKGQFIINPAALSRWQSLDLCTLCHGGRLQKTRPSFQFTAGNRINDFFIHDTVSMDAVNIDVHGNQYGLMAASKCFKNSATLTCVTCHNTHENEQGKTAVFAARCVNCHSAAHGGTECKISKTAGVDISKNCTGCHMPQLPSRAIAVLLPGQETLTPATMHTHHITSYPEETQKILAFLKQK
jgi:Cytochrome c554 and c-prime